MSVGLVLVCVKDESDLTLLISHFDLMCSGTGATTADRIKLVAAGSTCAGSAVSGGGAYTLLTSGTTISVALGKGLCVGGRWLVGWLVVLSLGCWFDWCGSSLDWCGWCCYRCVSCVGVSIVAIVWVTVAHLVVGGVSIVVINVSVRCTSEEY
jgi:hypothetical protein